MAFPRQDQGSVRAASRSVDSAQVLRPLKSVRLLDPIRVRIRLLHDSLGTEPGPVAQETRASNAARPGPSAQAKAQVG